MTCFQIMLTFWELLLVVASGSDACRVLFKIASFKNVYITATGVEAHFQFHTVDNLTKFIFGFGINIIFWEIGRIVVAFIRPLCSHYTAIIRLLNGHYTALIRPYYGLYTANVLIFWKNSCTTFEFNADYERPLYGHYTAFIRSICGLYTASIRPLHGHYTAIMRHLYFKIKVSVNNIGTNHGIYIIAWYLL